MRPCERGCPVKAISMGEDRKASIDASKCISCGECVVQCPFGAIMDKSYIVDVIQMLMGADKWGLQHLSQLSRSNQCKAHGSISFSSGVSLSVL